VYCNDLWSCIGCDNCKECGDCVNYIGVTEEQW
jgi:hypothetical protein